MEKILHIALRISFCSRYLHPHLFQKPLSIPLHHGLTDYCKYRCEIANYNLIMLVIFDPSGLCNFKKSNKINKPFQFRVIKQN